jgi:hypothetical protein
MFESIIYNTISGKRFLAISVFVLMSVTLLKAQPVKSENLLRSPKNPLKGTTKIEKGDSKPSKDVVKKVFSAPITFWRKIMSRHWGIRCSHYPSCSKYSLLAIEKHGPIIGFVMTFDRLQHESNEARYSPVVVINGETRVLDPVENNDFWWYAK